MDFKDFQWVNESEFEWTANGAAIHAPAETDYFVDPIDGKITATAPFFYKEVTGDFIFKAKVSLAFESVYDAAVLLVLDHETLWAKACFEYTDFGTTSVVTVMTDGRSDDANGVNVETDEIWLQMSRKDKVFAIHYSLDGEDYTMARLAHLPMQHTIKVGLEAQSPTGKGGKRMFEEISLELKSPADIRAGE